MESSRVILAIDPGLSAGVCIFDKDGRFYSGPVDIGSPTDLLATRTQIEQKVPSEVWLEAVGYGRSLYRKDPKYNAGVLVGALGLQNLPLYFVGVGTWRKYILGTANAGKKEAMAWVKKEYDYECKNHDEAEAVCIGHYAYYDGDNK